ncbi:MAG: efflux RND transporter periplasmic adaptor subunit [Gammaproteobacteria bacterium]|nr:efflux RND transporter periplasmic adaptor subunit [Gammaproteobacteria bacterium]
MTHGNGGARLFVREQAATFTASFLLLILICLLATSPAGGQSGTAATNQGDDNPPRQVRGVIKAGAEATISSEIAARIIELPYKEGEPFAEGDRLVGLDCSYYRARAQAAMAELAAQQKKYENNQQLAELDAVGELEVSVSASLVDKARAELTMARLRIGNCAIEAPYDGLVVERLVNVHESVSADQELIRIVQRSAPTIELIVPSTWLTWLEKGTDFTFLVDEIQSHRPAVVERLGAVVDPVSNTVNVYGRFEGGQGDVLAGMSGTARFPSRRGNADGG